MSQVIFANDVTSMLDIVEGLVKRGLTFEVTERGGSYTIKLTGGY